MCWNIGVFLDLYEALTAIFKNSVEVALVEDLSSLSGVPMCYMLVPETLSKLVLPTLPENTKTRGEESVRKYIHYGHNAQQVRDYINGTPDAREWDSEEVERAQRNNTLSIEADGWDGLLDSLEVYPDYYLEESEICYDNLEWEFEDVPPEKKKHAGRRVRKEESGCLVTCTRHGINFWSNEECPVCNVM